MHLTNYAINKENNSYNEGGHKRTLSAIYEILEEQGVDTTKIQEEIEHCIVKTLISINQHLLHGYRGSFPTDIDGRLCFELLGFDIMIDKDFKVWVLEVNMAPSFNTDTPVDREIKPKMFREMFKLLNINVEE